MATPHVEKNISTTDLDAFLKQSNNHRLPASTGSVAPDDLPQTDKVVVVGIMVDDSGSIRNAGLGQAVLDGLKLGVQSLRGARSSDYYLIVRGFQGVIFEGMLRTVQADSFETYDPSFGSTPLVQTSIGLLSALRGKAEEYRAMGVPTSIAMLILTDGMPVDDYVSPREFGEHIRPSDYIVGMGIARDGDSDAEGKYQELFQNMGVKRVMTPKDDPADIRHAMNEFSQSVASVVS